MIKAREVHRTISDARSSGDGRHRVDAYFVVFDCPPDDTYPHAHEWCCRFEVPRGAKFTLQDFENKAAAYAAKGWKL